MHHDYFGEYQQQQLIVLNGSRCTKKHRHDG